MVRGLAALLFQGRAASPVFGPLSARSAGSLSRSSRPAAGTQFRGNTCVIASCNIWIITQSRNLSRILVVSLSPADKYYSFQRPVSKSLGFI